MATWIKRDSYRYKVLTSKSDICRDLAECRPDDSDASDETKKWNGLFYGGGRTKSLTIVELGCVK